MKAKEIIKELLAYPKIAINCELFDLDKSETEDEFYYKFRAAFGNNVSKILTNMPKTEIESGTFVSASSNFEVFDRMPDIIVTFKDGYSCIFLWRIED